MKAQRAFARKFHLDNSTLSKYLKGKRKIPKRVKEILKSKEAQFWMYNKMSEYFPGALVSTELLQKSPSEIKKFAEKYDKIVKDVQRKWNRRAKKEWRAQGRKGKVKRYTRETVRIILSRWGSKEAVPLDYWRRRRK